MKKRAVKILALSIISVFLLSFLVYSVSAIDTTAGEKFAKSFAEISANIEAGLKPVFGAILGSSGELLVKKTLLFLLLALLLSAVIMEIPLFKDNDRNLLASVIAILVSIIGIRFMPEGLIQTVFIPNTAVGAAILVIFPFIIFYYFLKAFNITGKYARNFSWMIYGVMMIALMLYNYGQEATKAWAGIYWWGIGLALLMLWFDGVLQRFLMRSRSDRRMASMDIAAIASIEREIRDLKSMLSTTTVPAERVRIVGEINGRETALRALYKTASAWKHTP